MRRNQSLTKVRTNYSYPLMSSKHQVNVRILHLHKSVSKSFRHGHKLRILHNLLHSVDVLISVQLRRAIGSSTLDTTLQLLSHLVESRILCNLFCHFLDTGILKINRKYEEEVLHTGQTVKNSWRTECKMRILHTVTSSLFKDATQMRLVQKS